MRTNKQPLSDEAHVTRPFPMLCTQNSKVTSPDIPGNPLRNHQPTNAVGYRHRSPDANAVLYATNHPPPSRRYIEFATKNMRLSVDLGSRQCDNDMQGMHGNSEPGIFYTAVNDSFHSFLLVLSIFHSWIRIRVQKINLHQRISSSSLILPTLPPPGLTLSGPRITSGIGSSF